MALVTQDPNRMKIGGAFFLATVPVLLWLAYDLRDRPNGTVLMLGMAAGASVAGFLALRRAAGMKGQPQPDDTSKQQNKYILVLLPFGWLGFGLYYGLGQGNTLAFALSLIPAAISAGVAVFFFRRRATR